MQRALLQFFKPEHYFETGRALRHAGCGDLIGDGCEAPIPATPPRAGIEARRAAARKFEASAPGANLDQGGYHHAPLAPIALSRDDSKKPSSFSDATTPTGRHHPQRQR